MNHRPDPRTLGWLNRALNHEMGAVQQYLAQSVLARLWGDEVLSQQFHKECVEELGHAARLMEHLMRVGVAASAGNLPPARLGNDTAALLQADHELEISAVRLYELALAHARRVRDTVAEELFAGLLAEEAEHVRELQRIEIPSVEVGDD